MFEDAGSERRSFASVPAQDGDAKRSMRVLSYLNSSAGLARRVALPCGSSPQDGSHTVNL